MEIRATAYGAGPRRREREQPTRQLEGGANRSGWTCTHPGNPREFRGPARGEVGQQRRRTDEGARYTIGFAAADTRPQHYGEEFAIRQGAGTSPGQTQTRASLLLVVARVLLLVLVPALLFPQRGCRQE